MRTAIAIPLLLALSLTVAGCRTTTALPDRDPDITGVITHVSAVQGPNSLGTIRVEANPADSSGSPKYVLTLTRGTILVVRPNEITEPLDFAQVMVGQRVSAWITGPVRESYPMQATASHVLVMGNTD